MAPTKRWCGLVPALAVVLATVATPAQAAQQTPAATTIHAGGATSAVLAGVRRRAIITFDKSDDDPSSSTLSWKVVRRDDAGVWQVVEELSWRAGSGMLGTAGRNECAKGRGWLPNGSYRLRYSRNYHGNLIKGRAFRLDDHRCRNGRWRVQLFIHTEQGAHDTQCADRPGDQVCRWEMPEVNDYRSAGCIKMAPADLAQLGWHFQQFYKAGVRYPKSRVVVRVVA